MENFRGGVRRRARKPKPTGRFHRDIIVIGASAGGLDALLKLVDGLPMIDASILVVLHSGRAGFSKLPHILERHSDQFVVEWASDELEIEPGHIYIAVPDYHLALEPGRMRLIRGPLENRHRPAIDTLFRSAARVYGPRVIGVVLSGYLDDGSAGLHAIKRAGGVAVVQDPKDALVPGMPESAIATTPVDSIAAVDQIPALLGRLVQHPFEMGIGGMTPTREPAKDELVDPKGTPSAYTCPECHGTLWEVRDGKLLRYVCRVGHAYSGESMLQDQSDAAERALWAALRALEERSDLAVRMAKRSERNKLHQLAHRHYELADSARRDAAILRKLLLENRPTTGRQRHDDLTEIA